MMQSICRRIFSYSVNKVLWVRTLHQMDQATIGETKFKNVNLIDPNALQYRFMKYLQQTINVDKILISTEVPHLPLIITQIENLKNINNAIEFRSMLYKIDMKCCKFLNILSFRDILLILNKLTEIVPYDISRLNMFDRSIQKLQELLKSNPPKNSYEIVNFIFLISLKKKAAFRGMGYALKYLSNISQLSLMEKCIVSTASFKAGVRLSRENIQDVTDTIEENIDILLKDSALFVSLIKVIRYAGSVPEVSLTPITKKVLNREEPFKISIAAPLLALYAEALESDKKVLNRLINDSIHNISTKAISIQETKENVPFQDKTRLKDIDRLLRAAGTLNHKLTSDQLAEVKKCIEINFDQFSNKPQEFSSIILSLWLMGFKQPQTVERCFRKKIFNPLIKILPWKRLGFNLLVECVRIETPEIQIPSDLDEATKFESEVKPNATFKSLSELITCLATHYELSDTKIEFPIKRLHIYGISTRHQTLGPIHIDMLNERTCLRYSKKPCGMMNLKLRLLKASGYHSIVVEQTRPNMLENVTEILEEKIKTLSKEINE